MRQQRRFAWMLAATCLLAGAATAPAAQAVDANATEVQYHPVQILPNDQKSVMMSGGVSIAGTPARWFGVYFQLRMDRQTPLKTAEGEDLVKFWSHLFLPDSGQATWSKILLAMKLTDIESARNLPLGRRSVLYVVPAVWDYAANRYAGDGWPARAPLVATTDADGKVLRLERFNVVQPKLLSTGEATIQAIACELATEHLEPRPGLHACRAYRTDGGRLDLLLLDGAVGRCRDSAGLFFRGPVDSPGKARELAMLGYGESILVSDKAKYQAIVEALGKLGWQAGKNLRAELPGSFGVTVEDVPSLGWRVRALMVDTSASQWGDVVYREFAIDRDGAMGVETTVFAQSPRPAAADGNSPPPPASPAAYRDVLQAALGGSAAPLNLFRTTGRILEVPCPVGSKVTDFRRLSLTDPNAMTE